MIGTKLAHYVVTSHLGSGGMGEVYQATDTKLGRSVAIKVLPAAFASDTDRLSRFRREAQLLASLNHPNIAAIYGLEEDGGFRFIILELIEGETLAERLKRGPIPLDEALRMAKQIAEALEAAHEKGIIHRDLKPANIKLTDAGAVKVLDFGLAKALEVDRDAASPNAATMMMTATRPGMILGTPAYMSPEQANGLILDRRTDIFAFGAVLYEMLTGQRAFPGETIGDILAAVIRAEPDWSKLPANTPSGIRRLLRRCLQKDRNRRLQTTGDARIEIDEAPTEAELDTDGARGLRRRERLAWTALALVSLMAFVGVVWVWYSASPPPASEVRFEINPPPTIDPLALAFSPNGKAIVFVAVSGGRFPLWLHSLDSASARPLEGTDGASFPFWSPDNRSVAFFADQKLKKIDTVTGAIEKLADAYHAGQGGAWGSDGTIIFSPSPPSPLLRVSSSGGKQAAQVLSESVQRVGQRFPQFFPDGNHFFYATQSDIYVGQLDQIEMTRLVPELSGSPVYIPSGQVLFIRDGSLFAQNFDPVRLVVTGNPSLVATPQSAGQSIRVHSASVAGPIAYRTAPSGGRLYQLVWLDRSGEEIGKVGQPGPGHNPELSTDGRFVAMENNVSGEVELLEIERGVITTLTHANGSDVYPVFSPDGNSIAFTSTRKGVFDIYVKSAPWTGSDMVLRETPQPKWTYDWSSDGKFLLYSGDGGGIWALPMERNATPISLYQSEQKVGTPSVPEFSHDVKWIAYQTAESGQFEIYVQPFFANASKVKRMQISTNGGSFVRWRRDGKELFYVAPDNWLMSVKVRLDPVHQTMGASPPDRLFPMPPVPRLAVPGREYAVSEDGRFLMSRAVEELVVSPITVILNWKSKS